MDVDRRAVLPVGTIRSTRSARARTGRSAGSRAARRTAATAWPLGLAALLLVAPPRGALSVIVRDTAAAVLFVEVLIRALSGERVAGRATAAMRTAGRGADELCSARDVATRVGASDSRHRSLFEAAADGVVELDPAGRITDANPAFCAMCGLAPTEVVGARWEDLAGRVDGGASLAGLPETGRAVLERATGTVHLEASVSSIPGPPPGTLLVVRDATAGRVAEQTVRTLLQFLQNRDEDRTRLLKRSNAAIEAERNRIARDLHDGPIQGVSAAALSLEAVRLMLASDDLARARETLEIICKELGEEAMNLRRIMSDLRPPVLEQRGLIPAVRELAARVTRETGAPVDVHGGQALDLPPDVETLAYRVVQEALSNAVKHAKASSVEVRVDAAAGTLRVEVGDDGVGFDATDPRTFLKDGKVGLASMRERTELAGGTFTIRTVPGRGTTVVTILPFDVLRASAPAAS
jgi:PAS domain S-box-containing protein